MLIYNKARKSILAERAEVADTFLARFRGLMGRKSLSTGEGLVINPCNSIHMFFMKFSIDAVFLDQKGKVLHIEKGLKPWRISKLVTGAKMVVELPAGTIDGSGTCLGDMLMLKL